MFSGIPLFPEQASTLAADVDALYLFIVAVTAFFGILTTVVVIYFAAKYRTDDPLKVGARIHGSIPLELAWSIIPFLITIVIFAWASNVFFDLHAAARPDARDLRHRQTLDVEVPAPRRPERDQRAARARRPRGQGHVHVGGRAALAVSSRRSGPRPTRFPGATARSGSPPTKVGEYHLFCAEYCGTNHSGMVGKVVVMEPTAYQAWLTGNVRRRLTGAARRAALQRPRVQHVSLERWPGTRAVIGQQVRRTGAARERRDGGDR